MKAGYNVFEAKNNTISILVKRNYYLMTLIN